MPTPTHAEHDILEAALIGLRHLHAEIVSKVAELRRKLGIRAPGPASKPATETPVRAKRKMNAAARKRIGAATRKRWAEYRAKKEAAAKESKRPTKKKAVRKATTPKPALVKKSSAKKPAAKKTPKAPVATPAPSQPPAL